MKSHERVMRYMKLGKNLSTAAFIISIIGASICLIGLAVSLLASDVKIFGRELEKLFYMAPELEERGLNAALIAAAAYFLIELMLAFESKTYFSNVVKEGTPFTVEGAKELRGLGIKAIIHPGLEIIVDVVISLVLGHIDSFILELGFGAGVVIALGVMMVLMSSVCRYGAELRGDGEE